MRLLSETDTDPAELGPSAQDFLLRTTGAETLDALQSQLTRTASASRQVIDTALDPWRTEGEA